MAVYGVENTLKMLEAIGKSVDERHVNKLILTSAAGEILAERIRSNAPVSERRGVKHLRDSIFVQDLQPGIVRVVVGAYHAHLVEFGTAPHRVDAVKAKALYFNKLGVFRRFAKRVRARAHPFIRPAVAQTKTAMQDSFSAHFRTALADALSKWRRAAA